MTLVAVICFLIGHRVDADDRDADAAPGQPASIHVDLSQDWPWWRGSTHDGIASPDQHVPLKWSDTENIVWKTNLPGRGHGSPIVVGDQVVVTAADHQRNLQSVLCFDRSTGKQLWETIVHEGGLDVKGNEKSTMASAAAACDGDRYFVNFHNGDAVYMTALDRQGKKLWQQKLSNYVNHQGFGASPLLYRNLVIGVSDNKGGGAIVAMNRATGEVVWNKSRPAKANYSSPVIFNVGGKEQLFLTGCDLVTSLNPVTGDTFWEIEGATTECVTTTVTDGHRIFTSGGYPKNHVAAVAVDGSGTIAWENPTRAYVPSLLTRDGYLFAVMDSGIAMCWQSDTGKEVWKGRLSGTFSSSPVLVNDLIYATNEEGQTFVFKASTEKLEVVATNQLGDSVFSTPAVCGSRIYQRVAHTVDGQRQEVLYCIGE
ncbi:MAG: PQQ-binding-like beta-propeller repeat protein [Planctomycetaceae bacterium]